MKRILLFVILFCSYSAHAGYFEISGTGSYRKTYQDDQNYTVYKSVTGAVAYYFWELSAIELSYTRASQDEVTTNYEDSAFTAFYEADFIFTLATRKSVFQPYIKIGGGYQVKKLSYKQPNQSVVNYPDVKGWAPSGGVGFKFLLNENLALKAGIDVWSSPLSHDPVTYDYAARGGLSILF